MPTFGAAAAIALTLAATALALLPAAAGASSAQGDAGQTGFPALSRTVVSAIASTTNADEALKALGDSLAMIEARKQVAATAAAAEVEAEAPKPPTAAEIAADPSKLPAASAGSNGTAVPRHDSAEAQKIFAHSRGGGESTSILLTGIALPPPDAPEAVKDVIDNANEIVGRPYIWGGGHGSFYSYGYDCSGLGQLRPLRRWPDPAPAHLRRARGLGRARPGQMDHRLRQRRPHLRRDRRPALGHGWRRQWDRPSLAPRADLDGRLRRPPPAGALARRAGLETGAQVAQPPGPLSQPRN